MSKKWFNKYIRCGIGCVWLIFLFSCATPMDIAYFQDADGNYIYGISGGDDGSALYADVQKAIDDAISYVMTDQKDVKAALDEAQTTAENILKAYK